MLLLDIHHTYLGLIPMTFLDITKAKCKIFFSITVAVHKLSEAGPERLKSRFLGQIMLKWILVKSNLKSIFSQFFYDLFFHQGKQR